MWASEPLLRTALSPRLVPGSARTALAAATCLARSGPIRQQRAHLLARRRRTMRRTRCAVGTADDDSGRDDSGRAAATGKGPAAASRVRGGEVAVEQRDLHLRGWPLLPVVLEREERGGAHVAHLIGDATHSQRRSARDESTRGGEIAMKAQVVDL